MSVNPLNAPGALASPAAAPAATPTGSTPEARTDDLIDLRHYFGVLGRWWREILALGLLLGLLAAAAWWFLAITRPPMYAAAADVAIVRTVSDVTFDERFTTQSEEVTASSAGARRNALLALAANPALAVQVVEQLGESLPETQQTPASLAGAVTASLATANGARGDSDLIRITALSTTPEAAAAIATAWARAYVENVNRVYGQVPDELLASIEQELKAAETGYATAQAALEAQTARSRVGELNRKISDAEQTLNALRRGRQATLNAVVDRTVAGRDQVAEAITSAQAENLSAPYVNEQEGRRAIVLAYLDALYGGQAQVISEQGARDRDLLAGYYTRWLQITRSLQEAAALRAQVAAGDETAAGSSALVLSLLKLQALTQALDPQEPPRLDVVTQPDVRITAQATQETSAAASPGMVQSTQPVQVQVGATPLQLQLDDKTPVTRAALLADIDALLAALTERRSVLETQIADLSAQMLAGDGYEHLAPQTPAGSALVAAIQSQTPLLLSSSLLTGTASLASAADLSALLHFDDLTLLAGSAGGDQALLDTIAGLEEDVRALNAELEAERSLLARLTQQRDLALDSFSAVNSKIAELTLARAAGSSEVRFAAPGVPPRDPVATLSPLLVGAAAGLAGLILGVVVAFVADYMGRAPFFARRRPAGRAVGGAVA